MVQGPVFGKPCYRGRKYRHFDISKDSKIFLMFSNFQSIFSHRMERNFNESVSKDKLEIAHDTFKLVCNEQLGVSYDRVKMVIMDPKICLL